MNELTFRVDAVTDAAGKFNPNAVRNGNEDNVFVDVDLSGRGGASVKAGDVVNLGKSGMLMVVADGMGGMNAGEVASQIAVDTVKQLFAPDVLLADITASQELRGGYMESVIRRADANIKADAARNKARNGMGSTIIMAWLMPDGSLTVSWIGDSRAYVYNASMGLHLISEDHSYVQQLVNNGFITYEQSFDHPQNNVILKSLGDPSQEAQPETRHYNVGAGDTILLCSDGLSGVLRDRAGIDPFTGNPYKEEAIEDIIRRNPDDVKECRKELWAAAERGGWYDNVSIIICRIEKGPSSKIASQISKIEKANAKAIAAKKKSQGGESAAGKKKPVIYAIIAVVIILLGGLIGYLFTLGDKGEEAPIAPVEPTNVVGSEEVVEQPATPASPATSPSVGQSAQSAKPAQPQSVTPASKDNKKVAPATPNASNPDITDAAKAAAKAEGSKGGSIGVQGKGSLKPIEDPDKQGEKVMKEK